MFHRPKSEEQASEQQEKPVQNETAENIQKNIPQEITPIEQVKEEEVMNKEQPDNLRNEEQSIESSVGAPFQRPPQMQRSIPGGFSGTYPGATSQSYDANNGGDSRLVIGRGITMSGEIEACDHLLVEGTLEAALKGARVLEISETGIFYGAVEIEEATVAGRFEGDLTVNGRLTIKEGGSVTGSVAYKELSIEAGAVLDGKVSPLASVGIARAETPIEKKSMAPKNDNAGDSNRAELPFSGSAIAAAE